MSFEWLMTSQKHKSIMAHRPVGPTTCGPLGVCLTLSADACGGLWFWNSNHRFTPMFWMFTTSLDYYAWFLLFYMEHLHDYRWRVAGGLQQMYDVQFQNYSIFCFLILKYSNLIIWSAKTDKIIQFMVWETGKCFFFLEREHDTRAHSTPRTLPPTAPHLREPLDDGLYRFYWSGWHFSVSFCVRTYYMNIYGAPARERNA